MRGRTWRLLGHRLGVVDVEPPSGRQVASGRIPGTGPDAGADDDPGPPRLMTGLVFRRLRSLSEREVAGRLLADSRVPPAAIRNSGDTVLYGLWDLAAPAEEGLVAVAATQPP